MIDFPLFSEFNSNINSLNICQNSSHKRKGRRSRMRTSTSINTPNCQTPSKTLFSLPPPVVVSNPNLGYAIARNAGFEHTNGSTPNSLLECSVVSPNNVSANGSVASDQLMIHERASELKQLQKEKLM